MVGSQRIAYKAGSLALACSSGGAGGGTAWHSRAVAALEAVQPARPFVAQRRRHSIGPGLRSVHMFHRYRRRRLLPPPGVRPAAAASELGAVWGLKARLVGQQAARGIQAGQPGSRARGGTATDSDSMKAVLSVSAAQARSRYKF